MSAKAGSANLITGTRILCSIALLFCQTFSPPFFALYIMPGKPCGPSSAMSSTLVRIGFTRNVILETKRHGGFWRAWVFAGRPISGRISTSGRTRMEIPSGRTLMCMR